MAGLRYVSLDEAFNMTTTATSTYDIETTNDLFGFQVGAGWRRCLWSNVTVGLLERAASTTPNAVKMLIFATPAVPCSIVTKTMESLLSASWTRT